MPGCVESNVQSNQPISGSLMERFGTPSLLVKEMRVSEQKKRKKERKKEAVTDSSDVCGLSLQIQCRPDERH